MLAVAAQAVDLEQVELVPVALGEAAARGIPCGVVSGLGGVVSGLGGVVSGLGGVVAAVIGLRLGEGVDLVVHRVAAAASQGRHESGHEERG